MGPLEMAHGTVSLTKAEVAQLRHDNQYLKATNKELKRRLRAEMEKGDDRAGSVNEQVEEIVNQVERLEREKLTLKEENDALKEENDRVLAQMHSLKQYASRFYNISPAPAVGHSAGP